MKVSLISTVRNSAPHVEEFLGSVTAQTRAPDEVVIVDGGSTDGTVEILRRSSDVTLVEEPLTYRDNLVLRGLQRLPVTLA